MTVPLKIKTTSPFGVTEFALNEALERDVIPYPTVSATVTASATQTQAGATALTSHRNLITTVTTTGDAVLLPVIVVGLECWVRNAGANQAKVFPRSGAKINGGAADASSNLNAGIAARFVAIDSTSWWSY